MSIIDDRLAKERPAPAEPESAPTPRVVVPIRRFMDARRIRAKMPRGVPSFYIDYFKAVAAEMQRQGVPHFNPEHDEKKGGGVLSEQELDRMDAYAERSAPASEFVAWVKTERGL